MANTPDTQTPGLDIIPADASVKEGSKGKPVVANESVLAQMQDLYKQKQAEKNYFLQDLADASAWWSGGAAGPSAGLAQRAQTRALQTKELQDLQAGIAGQQNAIQNRNAFFGNGNLSGLPAGGAPSSSATAPAASGAPQSDQINVPQAKAGAQELNQRTGGLLGLIKDPSLQTALGYEYLSDPTKATSGVVNFLAKQAEDPQAVKEIRFAIQSGAIDPKMIPAAILTKIFPQGIDIKEVLTPTGEKTKASGFQIAGGYTAPAPAQSAPAVSVPSAPVAKAPSAPMTAPSAPMTAPSAPMTAPSAPMVAPPMTAPSAPIAKAPVVAGRGGLNQGQIDALGGIVTPGTEQAGNVLEAKAKSDIEAVGKGRQAGFEKKYKEAEIEGIQTLSNWHDAETMATNADKIKALSANNPTIGVFVKAGPGVAAANALNTGLHLGPLGTIGLPLEEAAARLVPGSTDQALRNREQLASLLHDQEMAFARMNKGQGSWSDFERRIMSGIVGSVSNSAQFLQRRADLIKARAEFDQKLGDALLNYRQTNKNALYADFQDTKEYQNTIKEYKRNLRSQFDKEFRNGKDVAGPVSDETKTILDKYPSSSKK